MIRKLVSAALSILLLTGLTGCVTDLGAGIIKELEDNQEGIRQELGELWGGFLKEANEWSESFATHSITNDDDLIGNREKGIDDYVGTYEADYSEFDGNGSLRSGRKHRTQPDKHKTAEAKAFIP